MTGIAKEDIFWKHLHFTRYRDSTGSYTQESMGLHAASFKRWREKDRRVKPEDFILSPTNMPRQETVTETGRLASFTYSSGAVFQSHTPPSPQSFALPQIDTHWEVPMRGKIKERSQNLAQDLAEYRQTCSLFRDVAVGIRDFHRTIRGKPSKRKKVTRKNFACDLSGKVLATNFGIRPTVSSLGSAFETLQSKLEQPHTRRFTVTKTGKEDAPGWSGKVNRSDRAVFYVTFDVSKGDFSTGNPAELMYELTPYSFVLDWMFPIGDYLASLDALNGVNHVIGTVATRYSADLAYNNATHWSPLGAGWDLVIAPSLTYQSSQRQVYNTVPQAKLASIVEWKPSTSFHSVVNGLALLVGLSDKCGHATRPPRIHYHRPPRVNKPWSGSDR